jgi:hypothetical protein
MSYFVAHLFSLYKWELNFGQTIWDKKNSGEKTLNFFGIFKLQKHIFKIYIYIF